MIEEACLLSWSTTEANSTKPLQVVLRSPWGHAQCPFTVGEQRPFGGITAARTEFPRLPDVLPVNAMCHTELLVPETPWPAFCCLAALMLVSCLGGQAWPIPVSGAVQKPVKQLSAGGHSTRYEDTDSRVHYKDYAVVTVQLQGSCRTTSSVDSSSIL